MSTDKQTNLIKVTTKSQSFGLKSACEVVTGVTNKNELVTKTQNSNEQRPPSAQTKTGLK